MEPVAVARTRSPRRRVLQLVFGVALLVVTFVFVLPRIADYSDVWTAVRSMSGWQVALLLAAGAFNLVTFAPNWQVALPGLRYVQSLEVTFASTAVANVVPAGSAVSFGVSWTMLREWGFDRRAVARAIVLTGVWNHFLNVGFPLVAVVLLGIEGQKNEFLNRAAFLGALLLVVSILFFVGILRNESTARRAGRAWDRIATTVARLFRRGPITGSAEAFARFREDSIDLLQRRWLALTAAAMGGTLAVFVVLLVALRVTGVGSSQIDLIEAFTAWSLVRLLTALPLTPGGIGITELGLVGLLTGFGGDEANVVAAVLMFRALTFVPPIVLGLVVAFTWRRHQRLHPAPDGA